VDSSVALGLLHQQNTYNIKCYYLRIWLEDEVAYLGQCPWEDDWNFCSSVCAQFNIPLESIPLETEYKSRVINYALAEARNGRTPNPDIMCNSRIKFGAFLDKISHLNYDYIASGHYARTNGSGSLFRAVDDFKDQSYFLSALSRAQLSKLKFPIGDYTKPQVRELASAMDLPNKARPDSQGLCFLGKVKFDSFIENYLGVNPGDVVDLKTNKIIGRHQGLWFHTIGQRKGLGDYLDDPYHAKGERAKRASLLEDEHTREVREMATDIMATSTTKPTHPIRLARFIPFALPSLKMRLASLRSAQVLGTSSPRA